jgi:hypothetical protein
VSDGVTLSNVLIDKTVAGSTNTAELPGGVGMHVSGVTHIATSIVRRSALIGIWADGTHPDATGRVTLIDGNTATMQVQQSSGRGIQLDGGPHTVKDTEVIGDTIAGTSTDGVVIGPTGTGIVLDGVVVKDHGGNGVVVDGNGAQISRCTVDSTVGLDAYVSTGSGTVFNGNDAQSQGHGFVVSGPDAALSSNNAEGAGDGFVLSGDRPSLSSNTAVGIGGRGFVVEGNSGTFDTNTAESAGVDGFVVSGSAHVFTNNQSKQSLGVGFNVSGTANEFTTNAAQLNGGAEWILGPGNIDHGGNKVNGSGFSFTSAGGTFN